MEKVQFGLRQSSENTESFSLLKNHKKTTQLFAALSRIVWLNILYIYTNKWIYIYIFIYLYTQISDWTHINPSAVIWVKCTVTGDLCRVIRYFIHGVRTRTSLWLLAALPVLAHPQTYSEGSSCLSRPDFPVHQCLRKGSVVYAWHECWKQRKLKEKENGQRN